jgi:hypothetical protein
MGDGISVTVRRSTDSKEELRKWNQKY